MSGLTVTEVASQSILTRTGGYLTAVASHSLQPYRGCSYGSTLCGVGCYVRHNPWVLQHRSWGSFLEVKRNAATLYRAQYHREKRWAQRRQIEFSIFCSSSTDPFVPQERRLGVTRSVLAAMVELPPERLILQTHSHRVLDAADLLVDLAGRTRLRVHVSVETDRERIDGLPPHASSVARRLAALASLRRRGIFTVATVAPLLPLADPESFFQRLADVADAVVIDHFIEGDGSNDGERTRRTDLPIVMERLLPGSVSLTYRDQMVAVAMACLPGRLGVGARGFAGIYDAH